MNENEVSLIDVVQVGYVRIMVYADFESRHFMFALFYKDFFSNSMVLPFDCIMPLIFSLDTIVGTNE